MNILGFTQPEQLDQFLTEMLPPLLEMERQVVNAQLDQNGELNRYVRERQQKGERIDDEIQEKLRVLSCIKWTITSIR